MPRTCCVCGVQDGKQNVTMHKIPRRENIRKKWITWLIENGAARPDDNFRWVFVCGSHFTPLAYDNNRKNLKKWAVPCILDKEFSVDIIQDLSPIPSSSSSGHHEQEDIGKDFLERPAPPFFEAMDTDELQLQPPELQEPRMFDPDSRDDLQQPRLKETPVSGLSTLAPNSYVNVNKKDEPQPTQFQEPHVSGPNIPNTFGNVNSTDNPQPSQPQPTTSGLNKRARYFGDFKSEDMADISKAKKCRRLAAKERLIHRKKLNSLRHATQRMRRKIKSLNALMVHLKEKNLLSSSAAEQVLDGVPPILKEIIGRKLQGKNKKKDKKYTEEIRKFALTIQFYSDKAYQHLRKYFNNLLPHPRTIRKWYYSVDGNAGFTLQSFNAIKTNFKDKGKPFLCNVVMDEMKLTEEIVWAGDRFYGQVDLGTELDSHDNSQKASYALVFMAVGLNTQFKVPLGYFLIKGLIAEERANLTRECLKLLHDNGATVTSVTFDGAQSNFSMANQLGAVLDPLAKNFHPYFAHPVTNDKVFCFPDPCHMLKLLRNALADQKVIRSPDNSEIRWEYIQRLVDFQDKEGLRAANKLTTRHVNYFNNKMYVKLAAQVLSQSTSDSLIYLAQTCNNFQNSEATSEYCLQVNNAFDMLNCKSKFSNLNFCKPINDDTKIDLKEKADNIINYLGKLKDSFGTNFLLSPRKTGAIGFVVGLTNIFALYDNYKDKGLDYFLTFKISQDFIETFFSAVRSRGGWNLYPNAQQFRSAYKRLLVKNQLNLLAHGNCEADGLEILTASSSYKKKTQEDSLEEFPFILSRHPEQFDPIGLDEEVAEDHFSVDLTPDLSWFVEDVAKYIGGFVVAKLRYRYLVTCDTCLDALIVPDSNSYSHVSRLSLLKDRGPYLYPTKEVVQICLHAERLVRACEGEFLTNFNLKKSLFIRVVRSLGTPFNTVAMDNHILNQNFLDNHRVQLSKLVIDYYLKVRLHHFARSRNIKENVKQKHKDLAKFSNK